MSSSSSSPPEKEITLKSSDGETFQVAETIALESQTIKHMIEDGCADAAIPLPNVTGGIVAKVIEYLKKHYEAAAEGKDKYAAGETADELKTWDSNFVKEVQAEQAVLFDLIMAANYLDIKKLLDLLCEAVANMMKGKQPEEIRKLFHIKNDYTPEEEEEVRRENQWAFE